MSGVPSAWCSIIAKIARSMSSSTSSGSLNPSELNSLMPLSEAGLWEAVIMTPQSAHMDFVRLATAGVGIGPIS